MTVSLCVPQCCFWRNKQGYFVYGLVWFRVFWAITRQKFPMSWFWSNLAWRSYGEHRLFLQLVQGFRFCGSRKFAVSDWLEASPLLLRGGVDCNLSVKSLNAQATVFAVGVGSDVIRDELYAITWQKWHPRCSHHAYFLKRFSNITSFASQTMQYACKG